ncbi:MAG: DUF167 family protein [Betaproteobacteria bacterium]|nr:DUF167 family protein [Betaproteobacteria bacterium]
MSPCWYSVHTAPACLVLTVHVQPNAKRTEVAGLHGDALKVRVAAPAVDGKANTALLTYLAELFQVPSRQARLKSGDHGRHKVVEIRGTQDLPAILRALAR